MINKFKEDFDEMLANSEIDNFAYIVDKKSNSLIKIDNIDTLNLSEYNKNAKYTLSELVDRDNKYNYKIKELQETIGVDKVVLECAQTLLEKNSFEVSINKLLGILCDFYGGEFACLFERDYETCMTNVNYKYHKKDISLINPVYTKSFKISVEDTWTKYLREHDYAFLQTSSDIDKDLEESSYYKRFMASTRSNLLVVSLNDNDLILGGIEIDNITRNIENVDLIKTISAFIVNNLHIKNTNQSLSKSFAELENKNMLNETMLECVKTLVYDDKIDVSINKLLEIITNFYSADSTNILYDKPNADLFKSRYYYAINDDITSRRLHELPADYPIALFNNFDIGGVGYVSSVREMSEILEQSYPQSYEILVKAKINSLIFVPLINHDKVVGFMGVENPKRNLNEALQVKTISNFVVSYINKNELLIKLEKLSYTDNLTQLYNRNFYNNYVDEYQANSNVAVGIIFADVNGLKKANDNFGHELGDKLIRWSANFFKNNINGLNFRIGGDEFVCIIEDLTKEKFDSIIINIKEKLKSYGEVHISIGNAWSDNFSHIEKIIALADEDMYAEKKKYYQELAEDERSIKTALAEFKKSLINLTFD